MQYFILFVIYLYARVTEEIGSDLYCFTVNLKLVLNNWFRLHKRNQGDNCPDYALLK